MPLEFPLLTNYLCSRGEFVVRLEDVGPGPSDEGGEVGLVLGERGWVWELRGVNLTLLLPVPVHQRVDEGGQGISQVLWGGHTQGQFKTL